MLKTLTILSIGQYQDYLFAIYYGFSVHENISLKIDYDMKLLVVFKIIC